MNSTANTSYTHSFGFTSMRMMAALATFAACGPLSEVAFTSTVAELEAIDKNCGCRDSGTGTADAGGSNDAGAVDAGVQDAGMPDRGSTDGGTAQMVVASATPVNVLGVVTVQYSNFPGSNLDWITVVPAGSLDTVFEAVAYTNGRFSGSVQLSPRSAGMYVARGYLNNSFQKIAETAPFEVLAAPQRTLQTDAQTYVAGATITGTYAGLTGNTLDWVALAVPGSASTSYLTYRYVSGASGTVTFTAPAAGTYELRAFANNGFTQLASSNTFTVTGTNQKARVTTKKKKYSTDDSITAKYSGLPQNGSLDWVTIAPAGSALTWFGQFSYIPRGQTQGTFKFAPVKTPGAYVIRVFKNNGFELLGESERFSVESDCEKSEDDDE
jgi:hypothetical protein